MRGVRCIFFEGRGSAESDKGRGVGSVRWREGGGGGGGGGGPSGQYQYCGYIFQKVVSGWIKLMKRFRNNCNMFQKCFINFF